MGCTEGPAKLTRIVKIAKVTKTAKFTIIGKTCDEIHEMYCKGFREGPEKATRIAKTAKFYENCEIYDNMY